MKHLLVSLLVTLLALPAWAGGPGFRLKFIDKVLAGEGKPGLVVLPDTSVKRVKLTLRTAGGKKIVRKAKRIPAGHEHRFSWRQAAGRVHYQATLTAVDSAGHETTTQFEFPVVVAKPLSVRVDKGLDQLKDHKVSLKANGPIAKVEYSVSDKTHAVVRQGEIAFGPAPAGASVDVQWEALEGEITRIVLKVFDEAGFWAGVELAPFWVEIPHEEVEFANGKWAVRPTEAPKLDRAYTRIQEETVRQREASKWGVNLDLRLYVGGYTDTVGRPADNQALSEKRARAIARYFRKHGFKGPIYYQGFGEGALYVETPDNTPEPKNRRALYMLANAPPPRSGALPRAAWRRLQ